MGRCDRCGRAMRQKSSAFAGPAYTGGPRILLHYGVEVEDATILNATGVVALPQATVAVPVLCRRCVAWSLRVIANHHITGRRPTKLTEKRPQKERA